MDAQEVVAQLSERHSIVDPEDLELLRRFVELDIEDDTPEGRSQQDLLLVSMVRKGGNLNQAIDDFLQHYWSLWYFPDLPELLATVYKAAKSTRTLAEKYKITNPSSKRLLQKIILHYSRYEGSMSYREISLALLNKAVKTGDEGLMDAIHEIQNS